MSISPDCRPLSGLALKDGSTASSGTGTHAVSLCRLGYLPFIAAKQSVWPFIHRVQPGADQCTPSEGVMLCSGATAGKAEIQPLRLRA
jgi:hypothetical protein